jgi:hypothetical protein
MLNAPQSVKNTLWSYDINNVDMEKDKNIIIEHVLNWGNIESILWLFSNYSRNEIVESIKISNSQNWSAKSLNHWSLFFGIEVKQKSRWI